MPVFYDDDYTASLYAFDTTRKSRLIAKHLHGRSNVDVIDVERYLYRALDLVCELHTDDYLWAVRDGEPADLAESQGFNWDEGIFTMALAHSAGLVGAVTNVLDKGHAVAGSLSSGLHHARAERGNGYCTFNGLAIAAAHARSLGAERVCVLDLDAHCGGGTRSMTPTDSVVQIDVSLSSFDHWRPVAADDRLVVTGADDMLDEVGRALDAVAAVGPFDLLLYNAGMDPINCGATTEQLAQREALVASFVAANDVPTVWTLAGGYTGFHVTEDDLTDLHLLTVDAFSALA